MQDVAKLKGQRTNKLMGWGLVVGLDNSGDGAKSPATLRALAELHRVFHSPIIDVEDLKANNNVAIVMVEVTIPEFGAREGQALDVQVAAVGPAKSIRGGRLLTTPMQDSLPPFSALLGFSSGRIEASDPKNSKVGVIRGGCTLEEDFYYSFIQDGAITLVLDESKVGFQWAQVVARAIDHELSTMAQARAGKPDAARVISSNTFAEAIDAKNVRVRIPVAELPRPANFVSRVLQSVVFEAPKQQARVVINRTTNEVSFTGAVTISPTVLSLPGLGTIAVGGSGGKGGGSGVVGLTTDKDGAVQFQELLGTLTKLQLPPEQVVSAVEHLYRTGTMNAQLSYTE
ncbi:MAG: flagellar basal body P-ring protein FlgI [Phycisphaerae bacterium]